MYTVYIIQSVSTKKYYIGYTKDVVERLHRHNSKRNVSTRNRGPWIVVYQECLPDRQSAWIREHQMKKMKGGNGFKKLLTERWPRKD